MSGLNFENAGASTITTSVTPRASKGRRRTDQGNLAGLSPDSLV